MSPQPNDKPTRRPPTQGVAYIDGDFLPVDQARIPILDWGFLRSDATYDVVMTWQGKFFRLDDHLDRFERSVAKLHMRLPLARDAVKQVLAECVTHAGLTDSYVEMVLTRGLPPWGSRDPRDCENRFYAFAVPYVWIADPAKQRQGLHLIVSDRHRIPASSVDPTVKNYHWHDLTQGLFEAYDRGGDTVALVDADGNVTEGPGFNLFMLKDGRLSTPDSGVLEGVTRRTVIEIADTLNVELRQEPVPAAALYQADEVFASSSGGGVLPVTRVNGQSIGDGKPGPTTWRIREVYWQWHDDPRFVTPVSAFVSLSPSRRGWPA